MKSIFSVFDLQGTNYVINEERFEQSLAKREIKKIIDFIVEDIESEKAYKADLAEWEREQEESKNRKEQTSEEDEESDIDALIKKSLYGGDEEDSNEPTEVNYSELTQRELQELIDDALDNGDYDRVKMLAQYMKEGKEIYLKEIERINEGHSFHSRRK
jgi:flagellar biosynthesis GTPase FlhF